MNTYFWNKIPVEYYFLVIGLYFGMRMVFVNPPWQTNDEDRHFYNAYYLKEGYIGPQQRGDKVGRPLPVNLVQTVSNFQGIRFGQNKISKSALKQMERTPLNPSDTAFFHNPTSHICSVAYIPSVIGMKLGALINNHPVWLGWWARIGALLSYLIILFYAIRITPVAKHVFMLIALTPMTLYQGASTTYDTLCISLSMLIVAKAFQLNFRENVVTLKDLLIFGVICLFQRLVKDGYFLIPFLILMIPPSRFENKGFYFGTVLYLFILIVLPTYIWEPFVKVNWSDIQAFQKDFRFNLGENLKSQLSAPGTMISNLIKNILLQSREWFVGAYGRFGYSYTPLPNPLVAFNMLVMLFVSTFDFNKGIKFNLYQRILILVIAGLTAGAIIGGFYFASPIGASMIFGLQGRYFILVLFLILLFLAGRAELPWFRQWGTLLLSFYLCVTLTYTLNFLSSTFYN